MEPMMVPEGKLEGVGLISEPMMVPEGKPEMVLVDWGSGRGAMGE